MKIKSVILVALSTILVSGCDFIYGVRRYDTLPKMPDLTCVGKVIRAAPGVTAVHYERSEGGRPLTWSGIKKPTKIFTFVYRGDKPKIWGALQLSQDYKGEITFDQTYITMNHLPDPIIIANTRPVMRFIELGLSRECGLTNLPNSIKETCMKVVCPPLTR